MVTFRLSPVEFHGMWENLIYDKDIKEKVCSTVVVHDNRELRAWQNRKLRFFSPYTTYMFVLPIMYGNLHTATKLC